MYTFYEKIKDSLKLYLINSNFCNVIPFIRKTHFVNLSMSYLLVEAEKYENPFKEIHFYLILNIFFNRVKYKFHKINYMLVINSCIFM